MAAHDTICDILHGMIYFDNKVGSWIAAGPGSVEDVFCQNFSAGVPGIGETLTVPLKDDGEDIMVTEDNRREFVDLYVDYYLNNAIHKQVHAVAPVVWDTL